MSWWGKLLGGAFGFMIGGPLGALIGAAFGHNFDRGLVGAMQGGFGGAASGASDTERTQTAFFAATFAVMGHIAKVDGRVSEFEIRMADNVMSQMMLDSKQKEVARKLFDEGKREDFDLDGVLDQFKRECHHRSNLIQMFIEIQIATLLADGVVHEKERKIIHRVGMRLGFNVRLIDQLIEMNQAFHQYAHHGAYQGRSQTKPKTSDIENAYKILGVSQDASDDEVKKSYRRLMNQHHPDKLVAKGLPEEMMKLATAKTQEIKQAYETIKKSKL